MLMLLEVVYVVLADYNIITVTSLLQLIITIVVYSNAAVGALTGIYLMITDRTSKRRK